MKQQRRFTKEFEEEAVRLVLVAARRIYEAAGFRLVQQEAHHSFGHDLTGENWERPF